MTDLQAYWHRSDVVSRFARLAPPDYWRAELSCRRPARILDVGCGGGRNLILAASLGHTVVGCDLSSEMCRAAAAAAADADVRAPVAGADMTLLPFRTGQFDIVVANGVLHNALDVAAIQRAIAETARVLRPSGQLFVNVFVGPVLPSGARWIGTDVCLTSEGLVMVLLGPDDMISALGRVGLVPGPEVLVEPRWVETGERWLLRGTFRKSDR